LESTRKKPPMFTASRRRSRDRRAVARERHGLFRCSAFAAARVRPPSIQNIRERYSDHVPRARIHGCETFNLLIGSAATATFFGPGADGPALRLVCHTGNRCFLRDLSVGRRATVVIATLLKFLNGATLRGGLLEQQQSGLMLHRSRHSSVLMLSSLAGAIIPAIYFALLREA
jgi:hypothetical protein